MRKWELTHQSWSVLGVRPRPSGTGTSNGTSNGTPNGPGEGGRC